MGLVGVGSGVSGSKKWGLWAREVKGYMVQSGR